ncbi:glycosyltransferase family 2 protein [Companilactobacillus sp. HBUAS56275]|uniref:Glycosyltransferase n=1 Tax=Candidatus Companilactobacillus pullicola TaxID=2838523 RepID=A0A9D2CPA5_9LACO|nr:glycosyltransferase [Candidatus Companilactobacillus pullicola]
MIIYLIAITVFMVQCFIMFYIYITQQKRFKQNMQHPFEPQQDLNQFFYFMLLPCLNEGKVIKNSLSYLNNLQGRKHIIVIDDDSDDDTITQAQSVDGPISIVQRKLPNARTGKGDALNSAIPTIQKIIKEQNLDPKYCIIGVLDADGVLSANSIVKLNQSFRDEETDAVQLRIKMKSPGKILQTFQDIEFFVINHLIQLVRTHLKAVALCGNGQFFRASTVLNKLGDQPWGNALLEDYELTLRMELNGLTIRYVDEAYVEQEALKKVKKLVRQRARWSQGGFNCWKYLKHVSKSKTVSLGQKIDAYFFFIQPVLNILADFSIIFLTINFILRYVQNPEFIFIVFIIMTVLSFFFGTVFTIIYQKELKLHDKYHLVIQKDDMINEKFKFRRGILSIGLLSYIYVIFFFSLIIACYHLLAGHTVWDKTQRN